MKKQGFIRSLSAAIFLAIGILIAALPAPASAAWQKLGGDSRITNAAGDSYFSSIVWTGSVYGMTWEDNRDGNYEIYFARIDSSGNKIGADVRITNAADVSYFSSLVWTGSGYGVSWYDNRDGNYEIYFARLDILGNKIGSDVRITNAVSDSYFSSLVWTGSEYGVTWEDNRDGNWEVYFARIDSSGAKIGSDVRITNAAGDSGWASLAWTGSEYGVSWHDVRDGNWEIYFARIDSLGVKIGSDVRITNAIGTSNYPSLAMAGSEYGVSWTDNRDGNTEVYFARFDMLGNKIGADVKITTVAGNSSFPSPVWTGSGYAVSWQDLRDGNYEIYFARIDSSGAKIGSDVRITNAAAESNYPSLVWTGQVFGLSWGDRRDGNYEIYFARYGDPEMIPTMSEWVMIFTSILLMCALAWHIRRTAVNDMAI